MRMIKKILSAVGILALLFVGFLMLTDDDKTPTPTQTEHKSGTSVDDENYYTLDLGDGSIDILKPQTIIEDQYSNMSEQRLESLFRSIYNYDHAEEEGIDVYTAHIPDDEQTLKEMLKEPYAIGSIFSFNMQVTGGPADGIVSGDIIGDDSVNNLLHIDTTYIGDEKYELMFDDVADFIAVYAGLDIYSTPTFIALNMEVQ